MQAKLVRKHIESEIYAPWMRAEAKSQHICARKLHKISDLDDGGASSVSVRVFPVGAQRNIARKDRATAGCKIGRDPWE